MSDANSATLSYVTLGDLNLSSPTTAKYIQNVRVWEEVNCHGRAEITFIPETAISIDVGCQVTHDSQDKLVVSSHITTEKGILLNKIAIVGSAGQAPSGKFSAPQIPRGYIVPGEVKAVADNTVQVALCKTDTDACLDFRG